MGQCGENGGEGRADAAALAGGVGGAGGSRAGRQAAPDSQEVGEADTSQVRAPQQICPGECGINQSWARNNTAATMCPCFQATKLLVIALLPYSL